MPKTRIFLAISILILATLACNALSPTAQPTPVIILEPGNPSTPSNLPATEADVPRISLEEAYTAYVAGAAIIVDVRGTEAYSEKHVVGALSIPLDRFEIDINSVNLDKDQWIITYCTWPNEHTSARAAFLMLHNGYTQVEALLGGLEAWINAGYPVEP